MIPTKEACYVPLLDKAMTIGRVQHSEQQKSRADLILGPKCCPMSSNGIFANLRFFYGPQTLINNNIIPECPQIAKSPPFCVLWVFLLRRWSTNLPGRKWICPIDGGIIPEFEKQKDKKTGMARSSQIDWQAPALFTNIFCRGTQCTRGEKVISNWAQYFEKPKFLELKNLKTLTFYNSKIYEFSFFLHFKTKNSPNIQWNVHHIEWGCHRFAGQFATSTRCWPENLCPYSPPKRWNLCGTSGCNCGWWWLSSAFWR